MFFHTATSVLLALGLTVPSAAPVLGNHIQHQLTDMVAQHRVTAGLVHVRDGDRTWSDAVGVRDLDSRRPADPNGHFRIGSMTKTFVATVVLQLVDEGRLALDDPIERSLPGVVPHGERVTVRQILQHTSGLPDYMSEPGYSTNRWRGTARFDDHTPSRLLDVAFSRDPYFPPGTGWHYSNTNYVVAGLLIEKLTGHPYGAEIHRRILEPLQLRDTSVPGHRALLPEPHTHGYEPVPEGGSRLVDATAMDPSLDWAAGEMLSTNRDLDRFFGALLDGRLTSSASLAEMRGTTRAVPGLYRYGLGLQEFSVPCSTGPVSLWGHTGQLVGYVTVALRDDAGSSITLALNPAQRDPSTESVLDVVRSAVC